MRKIAVRQKVSTEYGLSSYNVNKILQDPYGYIWLGTQDGLNRYDGKNFIIYSRSSDSVHRLLGNVINDLVLDTARKVLWVTTSYGGLNGIDLLTGHVIHAMKTALLKDRFKNEWLKCLNIADGRLWIGTFDGLQVYDPDKKSFLPVDALPWPKKENGAGHNISFIYPDQYHHVWVYLPAYGIAVYHAATGQLINQYSPAQMGVQSSLGFLQFSSRIIRWSDHQLLWATDHGFRLLTYDPHGNVVSSDDQLPINKSFGTQPIFSCAKDPQGNIWFSTFEHLYRWSPGSSTYERIEDIVYTPANDYLTTVMHVFFDNQDNLWLGTQYGAGVCDYQLPAILPFYKDRSTNQQINHAYFVLPADDSVVYVAAQHGAFAVNKRSGVIHTLSSARRFNYIFQVPGKHFIFSNDDGLHVLDKNDVLTPIHNRYPEWQGLGHEMINAVVASGDSMLLLSSEKNNVVYQWNVRRHTLSLVTLSVPADEKGIINTLYLDRDHVAWILFDNAIATYDVVKRSSQYLRLEDPDLHIPLNIFMDMCEWRGDYFLAVYGKGIVQLDRNKKIRNIYGQRDGLLNTGVYSVIPYRDSLLFVTSNYGLFTIDPTSRHVRQYLVSDGLNTNNFEENCAFSYRDEIIAGGEQGISVIRPALLTENKQHAPLYVSRIVCEKEGAVEDTFNLFLHSFTIRNDVKQATVHFSALHFAHPEKMHYAYRIPQLADGWIELGQQTSISLIGLMPGHYQLQVKAVHENGTQSMARTMQLYVQPKWFQTALFKIAVILLATALLYGFYRYRLAQVRKQEQIRRDIASDLHDEIGSTLNSAKIFSHLIRRRQQPEKHLDDLDHALTQAISAIRDIIWLLDDQRDSYADFMERIRRFAQPVADAQGIALQTVIDPERTDRKMNKAEKKAFFLIAKEAINNSFKYAACSQIVVELQPDGEAHTLSVRDDGQGFDAATAVTGNGLGNMQYRAEKIGYRTVLAATPGNGVTIQVKKR